MLDGSGGLPVLGMPGSRLLALAGERGRGVVLEGFPDRGYAADGRLLPRDRPGALLNDATASPRARSSWPPRSTRSACTATRPGAVETAMPYAARSRTPGWTSGPAGRDGGSQPVHERRDCLWSTARLLWGTLWDPKFVNETLAAGSRGRHRTLPTGTASAGPGIGSDEQLHPATCSPRRPGDGDCGSRRPVRWLGRHHPGQTEGLLMLIPSGAPHPFAPQAARSTGRGASRTRWTTR